ncbi:uncharacterized protein LOC110444544 [Mizuhopecten yessoensis]|uniref:uncharacterized protein LOC110444544 n=1 Tax=Mizuhopecten yessoensis TaxID=6573 RepID=UPI000B45CDC5|nr:uncharacterized protein LOC110444544 [Mizuhopecten yessoensis]
MISFMFAAVIDDGQSVLMQSARVREEYVGRGILSQKKKYCFNILARSAERSVYCTTNSSVLGRLQKKGALVVFQRNVAIFKTTNHTLKRTALASDVQLTPLDIVDAKLMEKIFLSRHAKHNLFPEKRIVVKCVPYQLVVSNIDRIFNSNAKLFASVTKDEDQKCFNAPLLISATTSMPCEAGTVIYLDFYGEIYDKELVTAHISKQMSEYLNTGNERLVLYVTYGKEHHIGTVQRLLSMYSWELTDSEINFGIEETI